MPTPTRPTKTTPAPPSYARLHHNPTTGFRVFARWFFKDSPFWRSRKAVHRAILFELFQRIAAQKVTIKGLNISVERGQWAMSYSALAGAAGLDRNNARDCETARNAVRAAVRHGVLATAPAGGRTATGTQVVTLFTWLDFEAYDNPMERITDSRTDSHTAPSTDSRTDNKTQARKIHNPEHTRIKEHKEEEGCAAGAAGAAIRPPLPPLGSVPCGGMGGKRWGPPSTGGTSTAGASHSPRLTGETPSAATGNGSPAGATRQELSPAQAATVRDDPEAHRAFIAYGPAAIDATDAERLAMPPGPAHWTPAGRDLTEPPEEGATAEALAAWWWCAVQDARQRHEMPRRPEPADYDKLVEKMADLLANDLPQDKIVELAQTITERWNDVLATCMQWMTTKPALDERTLFNEGVRSSAEEVNAPHPSQIPAW